MDLTQMIQNSKAEQINESDYKGEDDLWYCGVCHKPKQKRIDSPFIKATVWCICDCKAKELEDQRKKEQHEEEMRSISRLKEASMMSSKYRNVTFSLYYLREENQKAFNAAQIYVRDFKKMITEGHPKTGEKNVGLIFYGQPGTGKSFTAACIANALLEQNVSVIMTSFVKILQDIQGNADEVEYIRVLNGCDLLIIDDLGAERNTDYALEKVYNIIDGRVRTNKPMILTTNLSFQEMMTNSDIRYRRIYDRIFEHCVPVEIPGTSFRIMKAAEREKMMGDYFG